MSNWCKWNIKQENTLGEGKRIKQTSDGGDYVESKERNFGVAIEVLWNHKGKKIFFEVEPIERGCKILGLEKIGIWLWGPFCNFVMGQG